MLDMNRYGIFCGQRETSFGGFNFPSYENQGNPIPNLQPVFVRTVQYSTVLYVTNINEHKRTKQNDSEQNRTTTFCLETFRRSVKFDTLKSSDQQRYSLSLSWIIHQHKLCSDD
jgi:hypothetical protein